MDLGDLDLSQLRLTKKDLETLSSITPSLPKNVQDQLLAQLPPNQAKKLSRTLSMQNQQNTTNNNNSNETYRRSVSSNQRDVINRISRDSVTPTNEVFDSINNNTNVINASSRKQQLKIFDDSLNNNQYRERTLSPPPLIPPTSSSSRGQYYSNHKNIKNNISTSNEDIERACFSPPPLKEETKKTKRFSRSEGIYDEQKTQKQELATQKILREMRERSQEKSINHEAEVKGNKISYYLDKYATSEINKAFDNGNSIYTSQQPTSSTINDKILDELNSISLLNNQLEKFDQLEAKNAKEDGHVKRKKTPSRLKEKVEEKVPLLPDVVENVMTPTSKIARPKSFIVKDVPLKPVKSSEKVLNQSVDMPTKLERPKSFPNSKFATPKELKKLSDTLDNALNESIANGESQTNNSNSIEIEPTKKVKKIIKVVKKSSKKSTATVASTNNEQQNEALVPEAVTLSMADVKKEKSPEKKSGGKGLLYTLGQKFEKLRDTKGKKSGDVDLPAPQQSSTEVVATTTTSNIDMKEKKKKLKAMLNEDVDELTRQERKTKIDALIKNLKEKSIPHNSELTESGLIKRAVSVEEMPNTFNKNTVNKVLGLFKRIEKENDNKSNKVQSTKSTGYLSSIEMSSSAENASNPKDINLATKERPKSSGFIKRNGSNFEPLANICESKIPIKYTCPDCKTNDAVASSAVVKRHSNDDSHQQTSVEEKERLKNNRKGLMLDFTRFKSPEPENKSNYSFPPPLPKEIVKSPETPTHTLYENLTNYSSNACFDTSSLSPNEDIAYDGWSTCSDDHMTALHHPAGSLSLSRLRSTQSQGHDDPDESVVDRIRRKSFYSRFNEKKPKRVSNIVGPAAKDYYRDRSKPLEYTKSATTVIPDLSTSSRASSVEPHIRSTSRYSTAANRSLSQTRPSKYASSSSNASEKYEKSAASDLPPTSSNSTSYHRRNESNHLSSLPPPYHVHHTTHHHHMLTSPVDDISKLKSNRNTMYDSSSSSSTNTPSLSSLYAKRRSFVSTSGNSSSTNTSSYYSSASSTLKPPHSFVDGYATIGRKMRQYNTRSVSLLDPSILGTSSGAHDRDHSSHRSYVNGYGGDSNGNLSSSR